MNKTTIMALGAALTTLGMAQTAMTPEILYSPGRDAKDQGIALKGWGSGTISETDEVAYEGAHSIRVSTRNYFQGGSMTFAAPQDLTNRYDDKNNLLKITFRTADASSMGFGGRGGVGGPGAGGKGLGGNRSGGGAPGAGGGFPGGGGGRGGPPGGFGGPGGGQGGPPGGFGGIGGGQGGPPGGLGGQRGMGGPGGQTKQEPKLDMMRLIVTTTDGKRSEAYIPVNTSASTDRGWKVVSVPLQAIRGFDRTNKDVKEISFSGDQQSTFYVGDLRVINDATPITGEIEKANDLNLALGDTVTFRAYGSGGASILKYSWNFDSEHSTEDDATGQVIERKFRKPGKFVVKLTISDEYGLKAPYTTQMHVTVNP